MLDLAYPDRSKGAWSVLLAALPDSVSALLEGLFQGTPVVRAGCAAILDHADHDDRIERALIQALNDPDWRVRKAAVHSLSCADCKPDGCLTTDGIGALINGLLHDPDIRVRKSCAGTMMHGQAGRSDRVTAAFRTVLATSPNKMLRERAATYLVSLEVPRESPATRQYYARRNARLAELLAS
ncbi:MAG: sister chromatid cohesion protein PDS5 [Actinobacteria bacterium]|nr:sister chromatid cohesion protein PDS5 [Actinomycetota bacterium]